MAAGDRSKKIKDRIKLITGISNTEMPDSMIYSIADTIVERVAEETLSIQKNDTLTVTSGVASEPTGLFRIKVVVMPSSTYLQPIEVDAITYDEYTRVNPISSAFVPKIYKRWVDANEAKKLTFFPSETATYSILYYAIPTTNISSTIDPETPTRYDNLIYYGVLSELLPMNGKLDVATYYRGLFINELEVNKNLQRKEKSTTNLISFYDI